MTLLAINGASGKMGRTLLSALASMSAKQSLLQLGAAIEAPTSEYIGKNVSLLNGDMSSKISVSADIRKVLTHFDCVIDFSRPEVTLANLAVCKMHSKKMVIGTTGFSDDQKQQIQDAAKTIPIVLASNMSIGVNVSYKLLEMAATLLGDEVDIEIIEAHHRHKIDAPSGTAISMGEVIAKALGRNLKDCAIYGREGVTGARDRKTIGFETIRAGDIVGEHTVLFAGEGERIEIRHIATSRMNFARGALRAAEWLNTKQNGLFNMQDVLGLS